MPSLHGILQYRLFSRKLQPDSKIYSVNLYFKQVMLILLYSSYTDHPQAINKSIRDDGGVEFSPAGFGGRLGVNENLP